MPKKVTIDFACDQKWCGMYQVGNDARHCTKCDELVKDFSKGTSPILSEAKCGQFSVDQIGEIHSRLNLHQLGIASFSLLTLFGINPDDAVAQTTTERTLKTDLEKNNGSIMISGIVKDQNTDHPIPYVNVALLKKETLVVSAVTNIKGEFSLSSIDTTENSLRDFELVFQSLGFKSDTVNASKFLHQFDGLEMVADMATCIEFKVPLNSNLTTIVGMIAIESDTNTINKIQVPKGH